MTSEIREAMAMAMTEKTRGAAAAMMMTQTRRILGTTMTETNLADLW
jgi:hypothetical protein